MGNRACAYSGGSGAGYHGIIKLNNTVIANVVVGSAGDGYQQDINRTPPDSKPGDASTFTINDEVLISAGGGGGARSWQSGGSVGTGGIINVTGIEEVTMFFKTNGNNGNGGSSSTNINRDGAASVYAGHTYGASGNAHGDPGGGRGYPSKHGYVLIKFLGPLVTYTINPTPSDATVTLTASGYTQSGNTIYVMNGTSVDWSVSKSGYITQSGTTTITQNTTTSIELEPMVGSLYYCYRTSIFSAYVYVYSQEKPTTSGTYTFYGKSNGSQATDSSQLAVSGSYSITNVTSSSFKAGDDTYNYYQQGDLYS